MSPTAALHAKPRPSTKPVRLSLLPKKAQGIVVEHRTEASIAQRLAALGLGVGARFRVLQTGSRLTVLVGESRIGLGPDLAEAVWAIAR